MTIKRSVFTFQKTENYLVELSEIGQTNLRLERLGKHLSKQLFRALGNRKKVLFVKVRAAMKKIFEKNKIALEEFERIK